MIYEIFNGDELINTIISSEEFVEEYCSKYHYTYKRMDEPKSESIPTDHEILMTLLGVTE